MYVPGSCKKQDVKTDGMTKLQHSFSKIWHISNLIHNFATILHIWYAPRVTQEMNPKPAGDYKSLSSWIARKMCREDLTCGGQHTSKEMHVVTK